MVLSMILSWSLQVKLFYVVSINASTLQRHETYSCSLASFGVIFNDSLQIDLVNALRFPIGWENKQIVHLLSFLSEFLLVCRHCFEWSFLDYVIKSSCPQTPRSTEERNSDGREGLYPSSSQSYQRTRTLVSWVWNLSSGVNGKGSLDHLVDYMEASWFSSS